MFDSGGKRLERAQNSGRGVDGEQNENYGRFERPGGLVRHENRRAEDPSYPVMSVLSGNDRSYPPLSVMVVDVATVLGWA